MDITITILGFLIFLLVIAILTVVNNRLELKHKNKEKVDEISGNKFHKILLKCVDEEDQVLLLDPNWEWSIEELAPHKYHIIGVHPVARRMDYIKENIVV